MVHFAQKNQYAIYRTLLSLFFHLKFLLQILLEFRERNSPNISIWNYSKKLQIIKVFCVVRFKSSRITAEEMENRFNSVKFEI